MRKNKATEAIRGLLLRICGWLHRLKDKSEGDSPDLSKKPAEPLFVLPTDSLFESFKEHIELPENNRILFSGKFGIGKTYFLKKFFDKYKEEYLYPSRYQISGNEKIIDFIKTDIFTSILEQKDDSPSFKASSVPSMLQKASDNKWISTALSLGKALPTIGPVLGQIDEIVKEFGTVTNESVRDKLNELKGVGRKKVLIVDDLDRLDPEHIFRICNVFSALVDEGEESTAANKLGFDVVIFVADNQNLKSIFHHRYGQGTESRGYFDKFYREGVFAYDSKEIIQKWVRGTFCDVVKEGRKGGNGEIDEWLMTLLLEGFLRIDKLNLRQIFTGLRHEPSKQRHLSSDVPLQLNEDAKRAAVNIKNTVSFLIKMMGSKGDLIEVVGESLSGGDAVLHIFTHSVDGEYVDALKWRTEIIFEMIEFFDSKRVLLSEDMMKIFNDMQNDPGNATKVLNAFRELLIVYIKEVHK